MPLSALELDAQLSWSFTRANGTFRATKQGRDSRTWSLAGIDLSILDQAIIDEVTLGGTTPDLVIDLTDDMNLVDEAVALTVVQSILIIAAPTVPGEDNCAVALAPGDTNPFRWLFGADNDKITVPAGGVYLHSYGLGPSGTYIVGQPITPTTKILKLTRTGPDDIDVFIFVGGSTH